MVEPGRPISLATANRKSKRKTATTAAKPRRRVVRFRNGWKPWEHQRQAVLAFKDGCRRFYLPWHRRAGKDVFGMNLCNQEAETTPGSYWHMFPIQAQAKRAIWNGLDNEGKRFIDQAFPNRTYQNDTDLFMRFENGSTYQMLGSDRYNTHVGSNTRGIVISEWALCDPEAWNYFRPILRANNGWAVFITTYRGRNHAYKMAEQVQNNSEWYFDLRTVEQTFKHDGTPIFSAEDIELERQDGMSESLIQQEYYLNPDAAMDGSIYGRQFNAGRAA